MSAIGTKRTSLVAPHMSAFDPKRTSTTYSRALLGAGFSPYQSARSNRYDTVSRAWDGHEAA